MPDKIDDLIKTYQFDILIKEKKANFPQIFKITMKAYELFYGEADAVPSDIIKAFIREMLEISPNNIHLRSVESKEVADRVIDRVAERIYDIGSGCLVDTKEVKYVT
jgi:hypothetical protein